jgi:hypothetical protein
MVSDVTDTHKSGGAPSTLGKLDPNPYTTILSFWWMFLLLLLLLLLT